MNLFIFIQIYYIDKKGARESFTQGGAEPRIAVALSYEYLKVIFTAENRTNNQVPYLGFHARYEYTAGEFYLAFVKY